MYNMFILYMMIRQSFLLLFVWALKLFTLYQIKHKLLSVVSRGIHAHSMHNIWSPDLEVKDFVCVCCVCVCACVRVA